MEKQEENFILLVIVLLVGKVKETYVVLASYRKRGSHTACITTVTLTDFLIYRSLE